MCNATGERSVTSIFTGLRAATVAALLGAGFGLAVHDGGPVASAEASELRAGRPQRGEASYYAPYFNGRRMANGERFDPRSNAAAHKTLPLGTVVRVTNLENGRSAVVEVKDRGPFVRGRIIDLTPRTAEHLDMKEDGTAPVTVTPLRLPGADGRVQEARR